MSKQINGTPADWLSDRHHLYVRFGLNLSDDEAKGKSGNASLLMLTDATVAGRVFPNAVVVTPGAAVSIEIRSKAEIGFGFSVLTGGGGDGDDAPIAEKLYAVGDPDPQGYRSEIVRRFQGSGKLITIDRMQAHLDASNDTDALLSRWSCDIFTWAVRQYLDPVTSLVHDASPRGRELTAARAAPVGAAASASPGADQPPSVRAGVVWADGHSTQTFQHITVTKEDDPRSQRIGFMHVNFFVRDAD